jgi:hypothetical protein
VTWITRRVLLAASLGVPLLTHAQGARRYVVVSLIGDKLGIVVAQNTTGSHLDRNLRSFSDDSSGTFDRWAVVAVAEELARIESAAAVFAVPMPPSKLHDQPELLLRSDGVVLPDAVVDVIERERATHVLLLTKIHANATFQLVNQPVGVGKLRGVGFYVDGTMALESVDDTEKRARGFISPYVYVRLSLVDVGNGRVVRDAEIKETQVFATFRNPNALVPWDAMDNEQKLATLRKMLESALSRSTRAVVRPS